MSKTTLAVALAVLTLITLLSILLATPKQHTPVPCEDGFDVPSYNCESQP